MWALAELSRSENKEVQSWLIHVLTRNSLKLGIRATSPHPSAKGADPLNSLLDFASDNELGQSSIQKRSEASAYLTDTN